MNKNTVKQHSSVTVRHSLVIIPMKPIKAAWFSTCRHVVIRVKPVVDAPAFIFSSRCRLMLIVICTHQVDVRWTRKIRCHSSVAVMFQMQLVVKWLLISYRRHRQRASAWKQPKDHFYSLVYFNAVDSVSNRYKVTFKNVYPVNRSYLKPRIRHFLLRCLYTATEPVILLSLKVIRKTIRGHLHVNAM